MSIGLKAITTRLGYQQITSLSSAQFLTVPQVDLNGLSCRPSIAIITPETQAVRWRDIAQRLYDDASWQAAYPTPAEVEPT